jgi:site-specific recombinase XerD
VWLADGRDVVHVKEAVGHADLRTTMGYTYLAREHL